MWLWGKHFYFSFYSFAVLNYTFFSQRVNQLEQSSGNQRRIIIVYFLLMIVYSFLLASYFLFGQFDALYCFFSSNDSRCPDATAKTRRWSRWVEHEELSSRVYQRSCRQNRCWSRSSRQLLPRDSIPKNGLLIISYYNVIGLSVWTAKSRMFLTEILVTTPCSTESPRPSW